jgi:predicted DNA-binding protein
MSNLAIGTSRPDMNVITLKIPEDLDAALRAASRKRGLSKSAIVREALEHLLRQPAGDGTLAEAWVRRWRGRLAQPARKGRVGTRAKDSRLEHILAKHLR